MRLTECGLTLLLFALAFMVLGAVLAGWLLRLGFSLWGGP
jgi:hypothetical protein